MVCPKSLTNELATLKFTSRIKRNRNLHEEHLTEPEFR